MRVELHMFGRDETAAVEIEGDTCAHCLFVNEHVKLSTPGEVAFVCRGSGDNDLRRVELVMLLGKTRLLACEPVTAEQARADLAAHAARFGK